MGVPWQQTEDRVDRPTTESITYTRQARDGNLITIARQIDLHTDEKVGDAPVDKLSGDGQYVFDTQAGLVQSLDFKEVIELNWPNITIKIPVVVSARLLAGDEAAKALADRDVAAAKAKAEADKFRAQYAAEHINDVHELPDGAAKTALVGGSPGGPFIKINKDKLTVIGFTISTMQWMNRQTIRQAEPLYEKPANLHPEGATVCLAKDGYVVGGIKVRSKEGADGLQTIFLKKTDAGVDLNDRYLSPWFGYTFEDANPIQLAGDGARVIGTFGSQNLTVGGIGLLIDNSKTPWAKPPADH